MRTSIATVCLSGTLEEKMRGAALAGFDGIEVFEPDLIASPLSPEQVAEVAEELGLTLDLYQPFRDLEAVSEDVFTQNLQRFEAKLALMRRMGVDMVLLCSNVATATQWSDVVAVDQIGRAADLAARYGVKIAYEALAWGKYVNTYEHAWDLVRQADRPNLGVCLDSFHILSRRGDVSGFAEIPGEKIFFVQLADAPILAMDLLSWSRHHRNFPGEGSFDLVEFYRALQGTGYAGPISLEVFSDVYRQTDTPRTAQAAMRSLQWLAAAADGADVAGAGAEGAGAGKGAGAVVVQEPRGWDFAEVKAADPEEVREVLTALGFADRGSHRTKDVQLLAAGDARVVLNGRARPRGEDATELVGVGLQVDDPRAVTDRARALQYPVAWRSNRSDEMVLRGVTAPDGSEFFVAPVSEGEPQWVQEFGTPGQRAEAESLILGIDHANLAQPWQWFDEGVLFYRALFGLQAQAVNEVASPQGLVRSQVMRTQDGSVRLALNLLPQVLEGSDEGRRHLRSAYPEHVAFRSSNVAEVARRAREEGLRFLPIPANYYEDLQARFALDEELLDTLRSHDLMYDRDADGEFLHFYTRTVGSVFFEVVERRSGYEGYGAHSAPVRLAAQYDLDRQ